MTWNFDLTSIPRGHTETKTRIIKVKGNPVEQKYEVFTPEPVWIETHKCWQPFVRPAPSGKRYDVSVEFMPVIEDVGSV